MRREEPDWFAAMARDLESLDEAKGKAAHLLYAGDIFDRWDCSTELINFAIESLPKGRAIPGQHDLPYHRVDLMRKSSYGTLVAANVIDDRTTGFEDHLECNTFRYRVQWIPWGGEIKSVVHYGSNIVNIAIVHAYCWKDGHCFPGVAEDSHAKTWSTKLNNAGYDLAFFGDNHSRFVYDKGGCFIVNCGPMMVRRAEEIERGGRIYLVGSQSGMKDTHLVIIPYRLPRDECRFTCEDSEIEETKKDVFNADDFVTELTALGEKVFDAKEQIRHYFDKKKIPNHIRKIILEAME